MRLVAEWGITTISVDYRLSPDTSHPGPVEDCYAGLKWAFDHAEELGIDRNRIAIRGASAGGGLAAALALLARDRGEVPIMFQQLLCPMLDDRTTTHSDPHPFTGEFVWTHEMNHFGWESLLGQAPGSIDVSPHASPARAEDLSGLPPTYIDTGALDLFLEEDIEYARRLTRAGVPVELHVFPGAYHGFQFNIDAYLTKKQNGISTAALHRAFFG